VIIKDKIVLRQLAAREWRRPEDGLARAQALPLFSEIAPEIGGSRSWRKEPFKKYFADFQAALFAYGIKQPERDYDWQYSCGELDGDNREADCFIRCKVDGEFAYKPVQLKEVVPEDWPDSSLQHVIDRLADKYTATAGQEMLVVAIYVNRVMTINFRELKIPAKLYIQQLWFYGRTDENSGFIVGDLLGSPLRHDFAIPRFRVGPLLTDGAVLV
jgi:hypothetical protein